MDSGHVCVHPNGAPIRLDAVYALRKGLLSTTGRSSFCGTLAGYKKSLKKFAKTNDLSGYMAESNIFTL